MRRDRLNILIAVLLVSLALTGEATSAHSDVTTCTRAIAKASAQLNQALVKLQQKCADNVLVAGGTMDLAWSRQHLREVAICEHRG